MSQLLGRSHVMQDIFELLNLCLLIKALSPGQDPCRYLIQTWLEKRITSGLRDRLTLPTHVTCPTLLMEHLRLIAVKQFTQASKKLRLQKALPPDSLSSRK